MIRNFCLLALFIVSGQSFSQRILNEIIVKINEQTKIESVINNGSSRSIVRTKALCDILGYYLIEFGGDVDVNALKELQMTEGVIFATYNEKLQIRKSPNDSLYNKQWALPFVKMNEVWDTTTGGKTKNGKEIVIAVLDDGFDVFHKDLHENMWFNSLEIPGDGKDNDNNGYVDDYYGFNVNTDDGTIRVMDHGTSVAGIMAAKGNNFSGVSGINWDVKLLPIYGVDSLDDIITAYYYVHKMRKLYNETNGEKGAFIVVTNYSGGIPEARGDQPPYVAWCEMYDLLGGEGILSIGATDNTNINVDIVGDMPSTCISDYFLCTTNIGNTGNKVLQAGYSKKYIALGAPGEGIVTLRSNSRYDLDFSGTSAAAPMVAGTVALLYSVGCSALDTLIENDRVAAALAVKNAILKGVTTKESLKNQTSTGGYLNAKNSLAYMYEPCNGEVIVNPQEGEIQIIRVEYASNFIKVFYATPDNNNYRCRLTNAAGQLLDEYAITPQSSGSKFITINKENNYRGLVFVSILNDKKVASKLVFFD